MPKEIIMLSGLPMSGKTYEARTKLSLDNSKIISRKRILFDLKDEEKRFLKKVANYVLTKESNSIKLEILNRTDRIIIDSYNLNPYYKYIYNKIAEEYGYKFIHLKIETPIEECIRRLEIQIKEQRSDDHLSNRDAIKNMAFEYGLTEQKRKFVVFELEGILLDISDRSCLTNICKKEEVSLDIFYDPGNLKMDTPIKENIDLLNNFKNNGFEIIILTRRPVELRQATKNQLFIENISHDRLIMMPTRYTNEFSFKKYAMAKYLDMNMCEKVVENNEETIKLCSDFKIPVLDLINCYCQ